MTEMSGVRTRTESVPAAAEPDASDRARLRGRIAAILTAVVFAVGFTGFLMAGPPGGGTTTTKDVTDYYQSTGSVLTGALLGLVQVAGCLLLLWFFAELRSRLSDTMLAQVGHTIATVGVTLVVAGTMIMLAPSGVRLFTGASFAGGTFVGVPAAMTAGQAGLGVLLFGGVYSLAAAVFLLSLAARRQGAAMPGWLAVAGMVIAVLLVASVVGTPALLLVIWLILVAAGGFRSPSTSRS